MFSEKRIKLIRIIVTFIILIIINFVKYKFSNEKIVFILYLIPYIIISYEILYKGLVVEVIKERQIDECFLMSIVTIGAFILKDYSEAVFVMFFYQIGELFQDFVIDKSNGNLKELLDIRPNVVNVYDENNNLIKKLAKDIEIGTEIIIKSGERIPIDGVVKEGDTLLNTSFLTGENIPKQVKKDDEVLSGMINMENTIKVVTTKKFFNSTASKIIELVNNAKEKKSKSENFITEFAKVYTPIVCLISILIFIVPTIYDIVIFHTFSNIKMWLYRALTILVISCPCALVVSIPLAFFVTIGKASKNGILIKGSNFIESISKVKTIIFDKTGTMTKGVFEVIAVHNNKEIDSSVIIKKAAYAEFYSNHPIANCIKKEYNNRINSESIKSCKEIGGYGLEADVDGKILLVGSNKLMDENKIDYVNCEHIGTIVHVAEDNKYLGHIVISDIIKPESKETISKLKSLGMEKIMMLTGDAENVAIDTATKIGIEDVKYELLPDDKLKIVENLINRYKNTDKKILFVGDGINDAPSLMMADIGVSMGSIGSDSAVESSNVVLMDDNPRKIVSLIEMSKRTMLVAYEIIIFSIFFKLLVLCLSAFGISNMGLAIFADVGVLIICILNALRLFI